MAKAGRKKIKEGEMQYRTGAGLILAAGMVWSTQGLGIRLIEQAESWSVLTWRSLGLIAALTLYITIASRGQFWAAMTSVGRSGALGALSLAMAFAGAIYAMQTTTIASAVVLFSASPVFAALIGWAVRGERVAVQTWLAILLAVVGIAVMVGGQIDMRAISGNAAALVSAIGFGAFSVSLRNAHHALRRDIGHFPVVLWAGIMALVAGAAAAQIMGQDLTPPPADIAISVALGIFILAGGMMLYTFGSRAVTAAAATLLSQLEVILGPFWVWLFLGEAFSTATAIGGAIVLAALVLNVVTARRPSPAAQS